MTLTIDLNRAHKRGVDGSRQQALAARLGRLSGRRLALALLAGAGASAVAAPAYATNYNVGDTGQLYNAIQSAGNGDTITFTQTITLSANLPNVTKNVTINGGGFVLNGATQYRGFVVTGGNVAINNLQIANTLVRGGNGGDSYTWGGLVHSYWGGGGGGGAGSGGGLFVGASATVNATNVIFRYDQAIGGTGGGASPLGVTAPGGGAGGGMFGNGGSSINGYGGGGGAGGGGNGGTSVTPLPQDGKFGGGGGGGAYYYNTWNGQAGARGGFGGGGGGTGNYTYQGSQSQPGAGGWGGSNGVAYYGGNGAGLGGAVFVEQGGTLTFAGTLDIASNAAIGGSSPGRGTPANGQGAGAGLFLQGDGSFSFAPGAGQTQTISNAIADQTGVAKTGGNWSLVKNGAGTTILTGQNQYSGGIVINGGLLQGNTSSLLGNVADNASLVFDQGTAGTFAGSISGSGAVTKTGPEISH